MKSIQLIFLLGLSFLVFSCTPKNSREGIDPRAEVKASAVIADSFRAEKAADQVEQSGQDLAVLDQAHLAIAHAALGKEFLLSTNLLSQEPTPAFTSLQSRVVSFILRDGKVYLLDVTGNNRVGVDNIAQNIVIAEFPVLAEFGDFVKIDFNAGMKQIITVTDMYSSDGAGDTTSSVQKVNISYLDEISLKDEAVLIRQVAQLEAQTKDGTSLMPVEVRYQIKPYLPDPQFVPVKSPGFSKVGYFEANPLMLKDGSTRIYAMKWNEKKTIRFAISANTPEKYRALVRDSLLYWNKTLGENKIEVIQLEDKAITAPHFDVNIVQWVDWDEAGYAFADAHVDPRSGEVTSAQIFFPSAFVHSNVPRRIRQMDGSRPAVGLKGFKTARLCARDLVNEINNRDKEVATTPEAMEKATRDYVYEVIAHELGHVLGLRHNFAGNLAANYDFKDRKPLVQSYYQNMKAPEGIVSSSSVMEYSRFEESSWNGDLLQRGQDALSYDRLAIEFLYLYKALPEKRPLFCTDSQISVFADCNMSDAGRSVISSATGMYQFNLDSLAARIINTYTASSKWDGGQDANLIPVNEVQLKASSLAETLGVDLAKFVSLMKEKTRFIAVQSPLVPVLAVDQEAVAQAEKEYLAQEVNRLGGLENLLVALPTDFDARLIAKFNLLIENPAFNSGVKENGDTYSFTAEEKEWMKTQVAKFAPQIKEQLILNEIKALSGENFDFAGTYGQDEVEDKLKWNDSVLTEQLAPILLQRFENYALSSTESKLSVEIPLKEGGTQKVELPVYQYSQKIRLAAADLFANGHEAVEWGFVEKNKIADLVQAELELIGDSDKIDLNGLNKDTLKWYLNNKQLESALPE